MKQLNFLKAIPTFLLFSLLTLALFAQDNATTTTKTTSSTVTTEESWYLQPWAWVVGAVILLLLLISLFRGRSTGATDSVTYTKTVKRDDDI